ncbi:MAG: hypothetical protein J3R72DRAFT_6999 [Linnemannia gamsii]|nr:MAG: hypothetical protein J3R72DRAFT_6999 [Linnemannia gamsii]
MHTHTPFVAMAIQIYPNLFVVLSMLLTMNALCCCLFFGSTPLRVVHPLPLCQLRGDVIVDNGSMLHLLTVSLSRCLPIYLSAGLEYHHQLHYDWAGPLIIVVLQKWILRFPSDSQYRVVITPPAPPSSFLPLLPFTFNAEHFARSEAVQLPLPPMLTNSAQEKRKKRQT